MNKALAQTWKTFLRVRRVAIWAVAILAGAVHSFAQDYAGPKALGPFRIDKEVSMSSLFARLGKPTSKRAETFCYRSADNKVFLAVARMSDVYDPKIAGTVTLSSLKDCINHPVLVTPDDLAAWKTERGVGIGSTEEQVEKAYGEPSKMDSIEGADYGSVLYGDLTSSDRLPEKKLELGTKALIYRGASTDPSIAEFGIKDGRVIWISLSYSE